MAYRMIFTKKIPTHLMYILYINMYIRKTCMNYYTAIIKLIVSHGRAGRFSFDFFIQEKHIFRNQCLRAIKMFAISGFFNQISKHICKQVYKFTLYYNFNSYEPVIIWLNMVRIKKFSMHCWSIVEMIIFT